MPDLTSTMSATLAAWLFVLFLIAGLVKGLAGFGLPWIAIPLMSLMVPVPTAVAWSLIAVTVANLFQAYENWRSFHVLRVIWPLLLGLSVSMIFSVGLLTEVDTRWLSALVAVLIQVFVVAELFPRKPSIRPDNQKLKLGIFGVTSGIIGGMTSFVGFPALQALLALQLSSAEFVFSASLVFLIGSAILGSGLKAAGMLPTADLLISLTCVLPVLIGVRAGKTLRNRISAQLFKLAVLAVLSITGAAMIMQAML
jgi:uncharacterized membrane protein YfcA